MSVFSFFTVRMHDMMYDLSKLSPNTEPSLNSRAAFVCGMSPIDLSSILSWSIKRPAGEKIVCSKTCSVYMPLYWWLESDYRTLKSFMSRLNGTNIVRSFSIVHWLLPNILKGYLNRIIKGLFAFLKLQPFTPVNSWCYNMLLSSSSSSNASEGCQSWRSLIAVSQISHFR